MQQDETKKGEGKNKSQPAKRVILHAGEKRINTDTLCQGEEREI